MADAQAGAPSTPATNQSASNAAPQGTDSQANSSPAQGSPADGQPQTAEQIAKKWRLKNGQTEREVSEDELVRLAQKGWAFEPKVSKFENEKRQMEKLLQENPRTALKKMLGDERFHQTAMEYLEELANIEQMDPKQRAMHEKEQSLREREQQLQEQERQKQEQYQSQLEQHYAQQLDQQITQALAKSEVLTKHPFVVKRVADIMLEAIEAEIPMDAATAVRIAEEEIGSHVRGYVKALDGERFAKTFGEEPLKKLREYDRGRVAAPVGVQQQRPQQGQPQQGKPGEYMDRDEWKQKLQQWKAGG